MESLSSLKARLYDLPSSVLLLNGETDIVFANPALEYRNGFQVGEVFEKEVRASKNTFIE